MNLENFIKDIFSLIKDFQGIIGILIGVWIASLTSKKERKQKDVITESERIDRYRLSAISERLAAHQKAFEIWYNLSQSIHSDDNEQMKLIKEARLFWITHCLYLTPKCRATFDELISLYSNYKLQRLIWFEADLDIKKEKSNELVSSFNKIISVGRIIQEEVDISYTEPESISKLKEEENKKLKA